MLTNKGERVFRPDFGADLRALLFENIIDAEIEDLRSIIQVDITRFFPNVSSERNYNLIMNLIEMKLILLLHMKS